MDIPIIAGLTQIHTVIDHINTEKIQRKYIKYGIFFTLIVESFGSYMNTGNIHGEKNIGCYICLIYMRYI